MKTFQKVSVDGIHVCGNWRAEHALIRVLGLILLVGNGVYIADVMAGLCSNLQRICWCFYVHIAECRTRIMDSCGIDW